MCVVKSFYKYIKKKKKNKHQIEIKQLQLLDMSTTIFTDIFIKKKTLNPKHQRDIIWKMN